MEEKKKNVDKTKISEEAKKIIKEKKLKVRFNHMGKRTKEVHSKKDFLRAYKGYDAFENFMIVRSFIQKKYDISINLLEILLFLFPKQYFTIFDYGSISKQYTYHGINNLLKTGMAQEVIKSGSKRKTLYTLSNKGKRVVFSFYEYLSGEKEIPLDPTQNKLAAKNASAADRKKLEMIKILQGISEVKKS